MGILMFMQSKQAIRQLDALLKSVNEMGVDEHQADRILDTIEKNWALLVGFIRTRKRAPRGSSAMSFMRLEPSIHAKRLHALAARGDRMGFMEYLDRLDSHRLKETKKRCRAVA